MFELLLLCVLYVIVWSIVIPTLEYIGLGIVSVSLLLIFVFEMLTQKDCSRLSEKGLRIYEWLDRKA